MPFTRTTILRIVKIGSAVLVVLIIGAYALWRSFAYAQGPHITLSQPTNYASITSTTTHVIGRVERANTITLNGKAITIDEQGNFDETIVVFPGTNVLTLVARDQFGRSVETHIRLTRAR
jgi:hypothetical protein